MWRQWRYGGGGRTVAAAAAVVAKVAFMTEEVTIYLLECTAKLKVGGFESVITIRLLKRPNPFTIYNVCVTHKQA